MKNRNIESLCWCQGSLIQGQRKTQKIKEQKKERRKTQNSTKAG